MLNIRKILGLALGLTSAAMGGLIASPTLHDRLWIGHAFLSEFPWATSAISGAGIVASLIKNPRSPWGAVFAAAGMGLSLMPMLRIKSTIDKMDKAMREGLGKNYLDEIEPALSQRIAQTRWSPQNTVKMLMHRFPNVTVKRDITYSQPGIRALKMDVYQPKGPAPAAGLYPAIVSVHGGAWRSYDKGGVFAPHHAYLASQGYVVFDIQYRFSGEAKWPAQLQDVQCAIRWVKKHAPQYRVDPERLALFGRSSGGHVALLAAYRANDPTIPSLCEPDEDASVKAVVAIYPPVDMRVWESYPGGAVYELMGGVIEDLPEQYADASVVNFVRDDLPPTLLAQGYMDELVSPIHVEMLSNLLRGTNTKSVLLRIPWGRHVFDALLSGLGAQLIQYNIDRFLAWNLYQREPVAAQGDMSGIPY